MSVISDALGEITVQAPSDPDAQATVTDFLDYTEYLPADLIRSLTLIRKMDVTYLASAAAVHDLTRSYGSLPSLEPDKRPDPRTLRLQISQELDSALHARECGYAEASRLYDVIDRHFNRLTSIIAKLHALPQPPSRDPTPVPQPVSSPQTHRSRGGRKLELEGVGQPRITLRLDGSRTVGPGRPPGSSGRPKQRHRRITIPGEVLPPPNPDSPEPMSDSGWESEALSPIPMATSRVGAPYRSEKKELKKIKLPKLPKIKLPAPRSRPPGMGTNVHSAVAGISSSNALALLKPPPEDAQLGSKHRPWLRLTEWEMAKLRKRMKKNAVWTPSDTMIRRELSELGRGPENYRTAKARAETTGEPLLDEDNIEATSPSKKVLAPGEIHPDSVGADEMQLSNRGMKLNEAKKLKKEIMAREAALAAAEAEQAAQRLAEAGSAFKNIFSPQLDDVADSVTVTPEKSKEKESGRGERKRKRDADSDNLESEGMGADTKKRRYTVSDGETITTVPLAAPGPSADSIKKGISTAAGGRPRRASMTPKVVSPVMSRPPSRPRSRGTLGRHSAEPAFGRNRGPARRGSTASVHAQLESTGARRRSKRPAPGLVRANEDGSMTVSIGKRKAAPRKKTGGKKPKAEEANATNTEAADGWEEPIDPNEPRYCICGDVSWGTMVACENEDCVQEWFHLECVGLTAEPGPRTKWYCPECREKFGIGNNGLVASRRR